MFQYSRDAKLVKEDIVVMDAIGVENVEENEVKCTIEVLPDYGHEWAFWDREVKAFLDWIPRTDPYYKEAPIRRI